ncbi:hypothetical protein PG993_011754 [Apiospora rasikravindrae]|uniref:AAA+ ATPase domain-containing protein n=1 Tax=Apiospora rasikravindrae TaxID=990691 RepID=A0ABR1S0M2_9PEZI
MTANTKSDSRDESVTAVPQTEPTQSQESSQKPKVPAGSLSDVKNIYRSPKDKDGDWTWVNKYPEDAEDAAENAETARYAVLVRNIKSPDSRKKLEAHSIVVQSPWLKTALGEILEDYPGVACELERLIFEAPFQPFVHRWKDFAKYRERGDLDDTTKEHLAILHNILQYEIGDSIKVFEDYVEKGVVTWENLWMVFQPGSPLLAAHKGPLSAFELEDTEYMENRCGKFIRLRADCIDYDGKTFGRCRENIDIPEFIGTKKILELPAYPFTFHPRPDEIRESLTKRGQLFEDLAGHHYKAYSGTAITWDREGNELPIEVSGRIIVDIGSFNRFSPINYMRQRRLRDWKPRDQLLLLAGMTSHAKAGGQDDGKLKLSPYHRMLTRCRTSGYSLKLKKWLDFFVEQVGDIHFSDDAFNKLVLPEDQKELIMAFSESQLEGCAFDDVISGKGKGVICLLSGSPGVGKTLTAEAVAENLRVPLHTLSSGDLGSDPYEVESSLQRILELVARWDAILLLDECDVFLEARSSHDLERNKVVSIFLRTLEYYEGILFMTTNRVENIDPAFQSRIHVSLEYPDLTPASRRQVWQNFLAAAAAGGAKGAATEISDADLDDLSVLDLNGRQIKNILKTAQLLASRKKKPLKRSFIDTILAIENRRPEVHHD